MRSENISMSPNKPAFFPSACLILCCLVLIIVSNVEAEQKRIIEGTPDNLSVRVKDADIKDFLIALSEISGVNMIIDPGVKGKVTLFLQNVSWREALNAALFFNDLSYIEIGSNGIVGPYDKMKSMTGRLEGILSTTLPQSPQEETPVTLTYPMSFESAKALWPEIMPLLSPKGRYLYNETQHCAQIVDLRENAERVMDLIVARHLKDKVPVEK
jgi:type II secretory pathway component GspD/PulD (secretin)